MFVELLKVEWWWMQRNKYICELIESVNAAECDSSHHASYGMPKNSTHFGIFRLIRSFNCETVKHYSVFMQRKDAAHTNTGKFETHKRNYKHLSHSHLFFKPHTYTHSFVLCGWLNECKWIGRRRAWFYYCVISMRTKKYFRRNISISIWHFIVENIQKCASDFSVHVSVSIYWSGNCVAVE